MNKFWSKELNTITSLYNRMTGKNNLKMKRVQWKLHNFISLNMSCKFGKK